MKRLYVIAAIFIIAQASVSLSEEKNKKSRVDGDQNSSYSRTLASVEGADDDIVHYHGLTRKLGFNVGMFIPMGDFVTSFGNTSLIGLHYIWEAISPFSFMVSMKRAASTYKGNIASGKLAVTAFNLGGQASWQAGRFVPFIRLDGGFYFNDVSFDATRIVNAGNDTTITTVGLSIGAGTDFIIGRELSMGISATYHYLMQKTIGTTNGDFNLGSPFATAEIRFNF